jgi:hypothetical protein
MALTMQRSIHVPKSIAKQECGVERVEEESRLRTTQNNRERDKYRLIVEDLVSVVGPPHWSGIV